MKVLLFMLFSSVEGIAIFSIMLYAFRIRFVEYYKLAVVFSILMSAISYGMREQLQLESLTPLILLFVYILFFVTAARIPLLWSTLISIFGYITFIVVQTLLIFIFQSIGIVSLDDIKRLYTFDTYFIQSIELLLILPSMKLLFEKGYGFTFNFDRFHHPKELTLVISTLVLGILFIGSALFLFGFYWVTLISMVTLLFILYLALRKEKEHNDNSVTGQSNGAKTEKKDS